MNFNTIDKNSYLDRNLLNTMNISFNCIEGSFYHYNLRINLILGNKIQHKKCIRYWSHKLDIL